MITQSSIDALNYRINIVDVISQYVQLKAKGSEMIGLCPFHTEKSPSFSVSKTKGIYKCFGCGKSGDAIKFVIEHEKKTFFEAAEMLAIKYNIELEKEGVKSNYKKPLLKTNLVPLEYLEWFSKRGISDNTLTEMKVTAGKEWMPGANIETNVICFNYYRNNELINIKYRGKNKDFKLSSGAELIMYNVDALQNEDTAIIVEGEIDALSLHQAGFKNVVSVPNGASSGNQNLKYLDNCWQYFEGKKKVILMTDNDEPGYNLREELARRIGKEKCFKVEYPQICKDANDILTKWGVSGLIDAVNNAKEWPIDGIISMDDMIEDITNYYNEGYPTGVKAGIEQLDDYISFMPGQMTVITGIPGSGKSEFTDWIMSSLSSIHQWSWAVCSFENNPPSIHATKIMEKFTGLSFAFRHNPYDRMNYNQFQQAAGFVNEYFNFININQIDVTLAGILEKAKELVIRKGVKGLMIDPWNYIEHKIGAGQSETQYISECLTALKAFALTNNVHIFLIAHPTKLKKEGGKYEIPTLYNISGSAHFFNKTDNGFTVYRDFATNQVDVYVQKIRFSWLGKIGTVSFTFDTQKRKYQLLNK